MKTLRKVLVLLLVSLLAHIIYAGPRDRIEVIKEGGTRHWYSLWRIEYDYVHYDPCGGTCGKGKLECKGAGEERCRTSSSSGTINIDNNTYLDKLVSKKLNKLMNAVDRSILKGKSCGSIQKKWSLRTVKGQKVVVAFSASWKDANVKTGDVKYFIELNECPIK